MNWVDVLIIIALLISTFMGFKRGLIKTLVPMVGLVVAISLAGALYDSLADKLGFIDSESWANIVAFAIILVAVFLAFYVLATILQKIVKIMLLGWVDRAGGAVFGFAVAWLVTSMLVALAARYGALPSDLDDPEDPEKSREPIDVVRQLDGIREDAYNTIDGSALATFQIDTFPVILGLLPGQFDPLKDFFDVEAPDD